MENKLMTTKVESGEGINKEFEINRFLFKKKSTDKNQEPTIWHRELYSIS